MSRCLRVELSPTAVMEQFVRSLGRLPSEGFFEVTRTVGKQSVIIGGNVVNGVPKIGTAFTP